MHAPEEWMHAGSASNQAVGVGEGVSGDGGYFQLPYAVITSSSWDAISCVSGTSARR